MLQEEKLKTFIECGHHIVMEYHQRYYQSLSCLAENNLHMIQLLFLNALESAGGSVPLTAKYASCNNFAQQVAGLKNKKQITFEDFGNCFIKDFDSPAKIKDLRHHFIEADRKLKYPHFDKKKSRLFLKELILLGGNKIFDQFRDAEYIPYLSIPIDSVIRKVYWELKKIPGNITLDHDHAIQDLAKKLFPEKAIYLDDLWFWGHFTFRKYQLLSEANAAMVYTDKYLSETFIKENKLFSRCNEFINIIKRS